MLPSLDEFRNRLKLQKVLRHWRQRDYAPPSPAPIKHAVLRRNNIPGATWIETGTARGDTTAVLARLAPRVITIEAQSDFYAAACKRFSNMPHVSLLLGPSEAEFPGVLERISGDICLWLDGHFSGETTFKGESDTPIRVELESLSANFSRLGNIAVLIDDVRCFDPAQPEYRDYPSLDYLVDWARTHRMNWTIEHDIFIAHTVRQCSSEESAEEIKP